MFHELPVSPPFTCAEGSGFTHLSTAHLNCAVGLYAACVPAFFSETVFLLKEKENGS